MRTVVVTGVMAFVVLAAAARDGRTQTPTDAVGTTTAGVENANFNSKATSKAMGEAATRLKEDVAENDKKLQELELDLKKNPQDAAATQRDISEILVILGQAADRLAPDAGYRTVLAKGAGAIRRTADQAEADLDREIRRKAPYLQQKASEIDALSRDSEEMRTRLVAHIDLLEQLKERAQFDGTPARFDEPVKNAQSYFDRIQAVATRAERLATELYNYGGDVAKTDPTPTPPTSAASATSATAPAQPSSHRTPTSTPTPARSSPAPQ